MAEMTDLQPDEAAEIMWAVFSVERALREVLNPDKINLATLGNVVPHVHWHVIPRWRDDTHFPKPIWGAGVRPMKPRFADTSWQATLAEAVRAELNRI